MNAAVKILIGLVFIAIGLVLLIDSVIPIMGTAGTLGINWFNNLIIVLTGVIPAFLILLGLFVVWLEIDEIKAERELKREEEKAKKEEEKAKKKKK
ncbi:MAG: hypothetical protein QXN71_01195 [Candidatus Aenigmatarchaeota archaeon]